LLQYANDTIERLVERSCDGVELGIRERLDRLDPALDAEDLPVDAQHRLDMAVLVGDLGRQQQPNVVVGGGEQERREQNGNVELGVEAMRDYPDQPRTSRLIERRQAPGGDRDVALRRRPLRPLPT